MSGNTPGCHGDHARHYIRRVQVNKDEEAGQIYQKQILKLYWNLSGLTIEPTTVLCLLLVQNLML